MIGMELMFWQRLKQARGDRGWTQAELGRRSNLHPTAISQFETGAREPNLRNLVALIEALHVKAKVLLGTTR